MRLESPEFRSRRRRSYRRVAALAAAAFAAGAAQFASAGVTSFDDVAPMPQLPAGYGGFNWGLVGVNNGAAAGAGYTPGVVSPENVAFNAFGQQAEITSVNGGAFDLKSVYLTAAWRDGLQVTLAGYSGDTLVDSQTLSPSAIASTQYVLNMSQITKVTISATGGTQHVGYGKDFTQVAVDDFCTSRVFSWASAASGQWNSGGSWDLTVTPASDDDALFNAGAGAYTASLAASAGVRDLMFRSGSVTLNLAGHVETVGRSFIVGQSFGDDATLTLASGNFSTPTASLASAAGSSGAVSVASGVTWSNTGSVYVGGSALAAGGTGSVTASAGGSVNVTGDVKLWSGGTLALGGGGVTAGSVTLAGGKVAASTTSTLASPISAQSGTFDVAAGSTLQLSGPLNSASSATLTKIGAGTLAISGAQTHAAGSTITVSAGTLALNSDAGGNLAIDATSAVTFASPQHLARLHLGSGGTATASASGNNVLVVSSLQFDGATNAWSGRLDIKNNSLIVKSAGATRTADAARLANQIKRGFNLGGGTLWGGQGIASSFAGGGSGNVTAVGIMVNDFAALGFPAGPLVTQFAGQSVGVNDILIKYTYFGDADLSGTVNSNDYFQIDSGFLAHKTGWINGDFDYDGTITSNDYFLIDVAFTAQNGALAPPPLGGDAFASVSAVPEPAGTAVIVAAASVGVLRRRACRRSKSRAV